MAGCEAEIKTDKNGKKYLVIKPKDDAAEGIISADLKPDDFEAIHNKIASGDEHGATLKFEGKVYGYGSIAGLFSKTYIASLGNIDKFDVSNVTDMSYMFSGCKNLAGLSGLENWKTGNVVNMQGMFGGQVKQPDYSNPYKVDGCEKITSLKPLSSWDTSKVTDMSYMFSGCKNLAGLSGLENWKTGSVVNMHGMFGGQVDLSGELKIDGCEKITSLKPLFSWDTKNVTDMSYMFKDCKGLNDIRELSQWDVSKVMAMTNLFSGCESLESIGALSNWKTSNVRYMGEMFSDCKKLKSITPLEKWDTSNLEGVYEMFSGCNGLTGSINLNGVFGNDASAWNTNSLIFLQSMFESAGSENFILDFSNKNFNNKKNFKHGQLLSGVTSFNNKNMFKNFNGVVIANNWSFVSKPGKYSVISSNFTANLLSDENDTSGNKMYECLFLTDNDVLLEGMKNLNYNKAITVNYSGAEIKLYRPAVLDSRINGGGRQPSSDPFEIVKHYIPGAVAEGAKTLRTKDTKVPTDYIAVAEKELSANAKLSDLFQTYTIEAAHTVKFMDDKSTVTTVKVEAGKKIADLKGKTIVTSDAVLTDVTMPSNPSKGGYKFKEWNTSKDGTGTAFTKDSVVNADTTVYAIYTQNSVTPPNPTPDPTPDPNPDPTPNPTPDPTPGGDTPGGGLNPNGGGSGEKPGNNPDNNTDNNPDNGSGNTPGNNPGNNNPNNTPGNGSNTNRNRNGGSAGGNGSNSSNSAKSNASDSAKDSAKDSSKDHSDSANSDDSAKDSTKDSKDSAKSSASNSAKHASSSSNVGLIASIIGALAAIAAIAGGFFFFILFGKKRKKRKDEDEN